MRDVQYTGWLHLFSVDGHGGDALGADILAVTRLTLHRALETPRRREILSEISEDAPPLITFSILLPNVIPSAPI